MNKLKRAKLIIRMALRNIQHAKLRAIILILMFSILSALTIMAFTTKSFLTDFYYNEKEEIYHDLDFYLTYNQDTNARYFSIRELEKQIDIESHFNYIAPFFNANVILETDHADVDYVYMKASSLEHLKKVATVQGLSTINSTEMIITKSLSDEYNIEVGDTVYLQLGEERVPFTVVDTVIQNGLFTKNTVFIDKDQNINYFLDMAGLGTVNQFTEKLYNTVYFSVRNDNEASELKSRIQEIPTYSSYIIKDTITEELIEDKVIKMGSIIFLVFAFILLSIVLVLQSTLLIIFEERKSQIGVTNILGARKEFPLYVILTELFLYLVPSLSVGIGLSYVMMNSALDYIESSMQYQLSGQYILLTICFVVIISVLIMLYNFMKVYKTSLITLSKSGHVSKNNSLLNMILSSGSVILIIINNTVLKSAYEIEYRALINVVFAFVFLSSISGVLLSGVKKILRYRRKKTVFSLLSIKNVTDNKINRHVIRVMLVSIMLVIILVGTYFYSNEYMNSMKDKLKVDYAITNIVNNYDSTYNQLKSDSNTSSVDQSYIFTDVLVTDIDTYFWLCLSMNPELLNQYLDMELDEKVIKKLKSEDTPYVVLPIKYHFLHDFEVGDTIKLDVDRNHKDQPFVIAGFADWGISDIIITNIHSTYEHLNPNAILLRTNSEITKKELIKDYSKEMYYIFDFDGMFDDKVEQSQKITQYITLIIIMMTGCFMITIFNNFVLEFLQMEPMYARVRVLGCTKKKLIMTIIREKFLVLLTTLLSVTSILYLLSQQMKYLLLFFGTYEYFSFTFKSILIALIIGSLMYLISLMFYIYKVSKIDISNVLKSHV